LRGPGVFDLRSSWFRGLGDRGRCAEARVTGMTAAWRRFHAWPRRWRWPVKTVVLLTAAVLTLYPAVWLMPVHFRRLRNPNALLDPNHPGLARLEERARGVAGNDPTPRDLRRAVEETVYEAVPYAWDWETWGVMDYLPTVDEVFCKGREDCDGRAIVAASLLRRVGQPASLASDLVHMWVVTPAEELMGPGLGPKTFVADERGARVTVDWGVVRNLGRALAFGVAVFPLGRELVLLGAVCLTALHPWSSRLRRVLGCALLVAALVTLRSVGDAGRGWAPMPPLAWVGGLMAIAGWLLLVVRGGGCHSRSAPPR